MEGCVHDPQRQLRIVRVVHASVLRLHLRDMLHTGHGQGYRPAKRGGAPVAHQFFAAKVTGRNKRRTFEWYSSRAGSTYVSSKSANFSISVNRLTRKVCFASNGCPFISLRA
jgi:hypothetical protein